MWKWALQLLHVLLLLRRILKRLHDLSRLCRSNSQGTRYPGASGHTGCIWGKQSQPDGPWDLVTTYKWDYTTTYKWVTPISPFRGITSRFIRPGISSY